MIALWRRSTRLGKIVFPIAILAFVAQLFFVADYSNDKTVMIEQMAKSFSERGGIAGREIGCRDFATGTPSHHAIWIEELPLFPYTAAAVAKVSPGDVWRRWTPWLYHALVWLLLGLILYRHAYGARPEFLEIVGLYGLLPIVVIHATKAIPEPAILALGFGGALLFLAGRPGRSLPLFFLMGLTKPLAPALVGPFALGWMLFGDGPARRRAVWGLAAGVAVVAGVLAWIAFLWISDIDNPLIRNAAYRAAAAAGELAQAPASVAGIAAGQYWSRYFTWVAARGVSWPMFALAIAGLALLFRRGRAELRAAPVFVRVATVMALFSPVFWAAVRGPQYTGPWYTLYVTAGIFAVAAYAYLRVRSEALRAVIALAVAASALPKVSWTPAALEAYRAPIGSAFRNAGDEVDCSVRPIIRAVF